MGIEGWCRNMTEYSGHMDAADWSKITINHVLRYDWLKKMCCVFMWSLKSDWTVLQSTRARGVIDLWYSSTGVYKQGHEPSVKQHEIHTLHIAIDPCDWNTLYSLHIDLSSWVELSGSDLRTYVCVSKAYTFITTDVMIITTSYQCDSPTSDSFPHSNSNSFWYSIKGRYLHCHQK